jgi:hypothetical protein
MNKSKSKEEKAEIKRNPSNYDTSEESFPFKNYEVNDKTNTQLENLINNDDNVKKRIISIIMKDENAPQQQSESGGGGGGIFSGNKKRRG